MKWLPLNALRGPGAGHYDISRIMWLIGGVSFVALASIHLWRDRVFSAIEFGTGFGLIMAAGGGATAVKDTAVGKVNAAASADAA